MDLLVAAIIVDLCVDGILAFSCPFQLPQGNCWHLDGPSL